MFRKILETLKNLFRPNVDTSYADVVSAREWLDKLEEREELLLDVPVEEEIVEPAAPVKKPRKPRAKKVVEPKAEKPAKKPRKKKEA